VLSNSDEYRKWSGNLGYDDDLSRHYEFDDKVSLWHQISLGSILVVSRDGVLAGIGTVHRLSATSAMKKILSCPSCQKRSLEGRSGDSVYCTRCKMMFPKSEVLQSELPVTKIQADYGDTWHRAKNHVLLKAAFEYLETGDKQSAIRTVDKLKFGSLLSDLGLNTADVGLATE
jgi:ribosomal protein L37AE/L43A